MPSAEYQRAWRLRNPGKQAAYCHKYLETHREERNALGRERYHRSDGKGKTGTWTEMVSDTEAEIRRLERRLEQLRRVLIGARTQMSDGVPFPKAQRS